ncbi:hypothetical protein MKX01_015037 [Papaver californicum]|nr:hypothetical protein MKX01_015037 [Papaver californicum]
MASQIVNSPSKPSSSTYKTFSHIVDAEEGTKWMTRVGISRKWNEIDFMKTNEVTSLDVFILDDNGDELHGVVPKKLIWKFDPLLRVGGIYSLHKFTILDENKIFRPARHEHRLFFNWDTEVKYLYVIGVLISLTNLQEMKRGNGHPSMIRNLDTHGIKGTPAVVVYSLSSSTNATKVFFNLSIPEVEDMQESSRKNKQHVIDLTMPDNTKTISELLESSATRVLTTIGC